MENLLEISDSDELGGSWEWVPELEEEEESAAGPSTQKRGSDNFEDLNESLPKRRRFVLDPGREERRNFAKAAARIDRTNNVMILEYLKFGDLTRALVKAAAENKPFPDRVLWLIFDCRRCPDHCRTR